MFNAIGAAYSVTMLMCTAIKIWVSLGRICESPYFPVNYAMVLGQIHFADFRHLSLICALSNSGKHWHYTGYIA